MMMNDELATHDRFKFHKSCLEEEYKGLSRKDRNTQQCCRGNETDFIVIKNNEIKYKKS